MKELPNKSVNFCAKSRLPEASEFETAFFAFLDQSMPIFVIHHFFEIADDNISLVFKISKDQNKKAILKVHFLP